MRKFVTFFCCIVFVINAFSQKNKPAKYPSLLWEITGNGLKKPSYLFGTMHVSSKMVFHLSDSFYHAIQSCDMVALELNPGSWQNDMFKRSNAQRDISTYMRKGAEDYLRESSFRIEKYEDNLKAALTEDPTQINGLLYRTMQSEADYEENTYLDLYIYQTGRKLGKKPGGVEDYYEAERIMFEAYQDMAKEKKKKRFDADGELMFDIQKKMQEAYRRGDLDLLDSLEVLTTNSVAFMEKFLYKRNEIQAASIDTILRKNSLFVGVGAAHLAGKRGVIELLRAKGYRLRPIMMQDRDATRKDAIDKMRVPVSFGAVATDDGRVHMLMPGPLYKRSDTRVSSLNGSWQYADMDNGSYYMLTRVKTHAGLGGASAKEVTKKIDSLLYENIPGKILKKTAIVKNGYPGFDITNRTRRGDLQRYNIIATPFEVLVFKMSGNDNYVEGQEAETFFNSIRIINNGKKWETFQPASGEFKVMMPHSPDISLNQSNTDRINRWEYEAVDSVTRNSFFVWKKSLYNYEFLEEDTFDISLIAESVRKSELIEKEISRKATVQNGYAALDMTYEMKNGGFMKARAVIRGPHYYLLAATSPDKKTEGFDRFFDSFELTGFNYPVARLYTDSLLRFSVTTPVVPVLDKDLVKMVSDATSESFLDQIQEAASYWLGEKYATFQNDTTGEVISVYVEKKPKYYFSRESVRFWKVELDEKQYKGMVVSARQPIRVSDRCSGYQLEITDTNTVRKLTMRHLLQDNYVFRIAVLTDTLQPQSSFVRNFLNSFMPEPQKLGPSVFENKTDSFFTDYYSTDSSARKKARAAISNVYFGAAGIDKLVDAINKLKYGEKDYFDLKSKLIGELSYIDDSCCTDKVRQTLEGLYSKTADTSYFQTEVLRGLARLRTKQSYASLKQLLLQDPPVFDNDYDNSGIFSLLEDSLALSKDLFPEVLQLASLEDYKEPVIELLRTMVDSGFVKPKEYDEYFSKIYFDAKIQLKRQQNRDEKILEKLSRQDEDDNSMDDRSSGEMGGGMLADYAVLLAPYYKKNPTVAKFFDKLLLSRDPDVQLQAAVTMVSHQYAVPDSLWLSLAKRDNYRARLLKQLEKIKRTDLFPAIYNKQDVVAQAILLNDKRYEKFNAVELIEKRAVKLKEKEGYVYFFKYKLKKEDDWKLGISGMQPKDTLQVSSNDELTRMTGKKIKQGDEAAEQLDDELRKLLFEQHDSGSYFFEDGDFYSYRQRKW
ncbi:TraB/GumN family protein [Filimonas effusa]|uniref:TraB/GumN family protein n=1 Tax=Filimonas effusa TaxID=2508721 RepID=A0A4Q1DCG9_9BACT|nr:TraB/GumN family protein [Filimonas effusa]RXK87142.1 TraB/GumN family protein [Filimonas effusa]